jgi:hypothetical protein
MLPGSKAADVRLDDTVRSFSNSARWPCEPVSPVADVRLKMACMQGRQACWWAPQPRRSLVGYWDLLGRTETSLPRSVSTLLQQPSILIC